jgi:glycosyltransferase involved in cell wall biosynthesis
LSSGESSAENFNSIFNTENTLTKKNIVLGVGSVHIRKGVDHFIECANLISLNPRFNQWRFIWIGKGYDPELDGNYSIFLKDQIQRSGLGDRLTILGETGEIMKAYQQSNILVIPSRLDPMPNVSLDAISLGLPLVCYDKTTGLSNILKSEGLGDYCVVDYMNTQSMADKIIKIIGNDDVINKISSKFEEINKKYFDFDKYIAKVNQIAIKAT